jgi:hypothetical protein
MNRIAMTDHGQATRHAIEWRQSQLSSLVNGGGKLEKDLLGEIRQWG